MITDQPGKGTWPISTATFILMHKVQDKPQQGNEVLKFFDWAYKNGGKMAEDLDYEPTHDFGYEGCEPEVLSIYEEIPINTDNFIPLVCLCGRCRCP